MACCKETTISLRSSCSSSLYRNPLIERKHSRSSSEGEWNGVSLAVRMRHTSAFVNDDKENSVPNITPEKINGKENNVIENGILRESSNGKENLLKPSSMQLCMKRQEPDANIGLKIWDNLGSENKDSANVWDHSDSEAAPVSSWSTLPNRSLLFRPLPVDVGRCTCIIVKERSPDGFDGGTLYTLYTNVRPISSLCFRLDVRHLTKYHMKILGLIHKTLYLLLMSHDRRVRGDKIARLYSTA